MEACATAHHWARELIALGHEVKLMPPAYVKAYVKRNKNDAADAEAICEAVTRPSMRFVPVKDVDQQAVLMMHRARSLLVRQRTMAGQCAARASGRVRNHRAAGSAPCRTTWSRQSKTTKPALPELARSILRLIVGQLNDTQAKVRQIEARLAQWHRNSRLSKLLATVPGVGIMGASAIAATVSDPSLFRSGREFAAWLGMTPRQNSSGGKERLGRTSKRGDKYIRSLLVAGAVAILRHARERATKDGEWVRAMLARKPAKLVAVALANRTARIVWAVMARGDGYRAQRDRRASGLNRPQGPQDCEGEEEVMAKRSSRGSGRPEEIQRASLARILDRDPIRELHQGQRPYAPRQRAGHMTAPDQVAKAELKPLAGGGRPHMISEPGNVREAPRVSLFS